MDLKKIIAATAILMIFVTGIVGTASAAEQMNIFKKGTNIKITSDSILVGGSKSYDLNVSDFTELLGAKKNITIILQPPGPASGIRITINMTPPNGFKPNGIWTSPANNPIVRWNQTTGAGGFQLFNFTIQDIALVPTTYNLFIQDNSEDVGVPKSSASFDIQITTPPIANFTTFTSCLNQTAFFNASGSSDPNPGGFIASYDWNFGDGTPHGSGVAISHTYATGGVKTVTLNVTDNFNNSNITTKTIKVGFGPVSVNAGPDGTAPVTIGGSPTASGGEPPYTYSWSPATGLSSTTVPNPLADPASTTTYTVSVQDSNTFTDQRSCWGSDSVTVTVTPPTTTTPTPPPPPSLPATSQAGLVILVGLLSITVFLSLRRRE